VIFTAYFDESDTHGPTPNVVMAGFVGTPYQWERFDKRLAKLQKRHGFSIFHSTEFKARKGEFAGWTDEQSKALIDDLVALVRDKLTMGLACTLPHDRFMQEYRAPPIPKKMMLDSQYGACFRGCLATWSISFRPEAPPARSTSCLRTATRMLATAPESSMT